MAVEVPCDGEALKQMNDKRFDGPDQIFIGNGEGLSISRGRTLGN